MSALFSIVTVTYNDRENLEKTILSVIEQKSMLSDDIEYIIIDGNSSDGTSEVLKIYNEHIDITIQEPDNGLYDAMNKGIMLSNGKYINFMNAGDTFSENNTLTKVKNYMDEQKNPELIYGNALEATLDGTIFLKNAYSHRLVWHGMFTHHQAMFYKLETIKNNKLLYDLKYKIAADYAFTYKFVKLSNTIKKIELPICIFLQGGLSAQHAQKGLYEQSVIRQEIGKYIQYYKV